MLLLLQRHSQWFTCVATCAGSGTALASPIMLLVATAEANMSSASEASAARGAEPPGPQGVSLCIASVVIRQAPAPEAGRTMGIYHALRLELAANRAQAFQACVLEKSDGKAM